MAAKRKGTTTAVKAPPLGFRVWGGQVGVIDLKLQACF